MGLFGTILMSITFAFMLVTLWSLRYLCAGKLRLAVSLLVIAFDGWTANYMMSNEHWVQRMSEADSHLFEGIIIVFMAQLLLFVIVLAAILVRFAWRKMMRVPVDQSRRRLLKKAVIYPVAAAGVSMYGGLYERTHAVERDYAIPMSALKDMDGYTVAQISDIHLGAFFTVDDLRDLLQRIVNHGADVLMVTGDLFDDRSQNAEAGQVLGSFTDKFRHGIYFCMGNHEYYRGGKKMVREVLQGTNVQLLFNEARQIPQTDLWIAGVEFSFLKGDSYGRQRQEYIAEAMEKVPDPHKTILLAHNPDFIDEAAERGIPLTLSGHTHGSQLGFFGMPLIPAFKYTRGMFRHGDCYGYVHCGNGSWFPFRLGCPPEIAYFTLQC